MTQASALDAFRATPLLRALDDADLGELERLLERRSLAAGEVLFARDDPGDSLLLIVSGQLRIASDSSPGAVPLARLGPGEVLGEKALLTGEPRSASALAEVASELLELSRTDFDRFCATRPELQKQVHAVMAARQRGDPSRPFAHEAKTLLVLPSEGEVRLGRDPSNDVVIAEPTIDAQHATLRPVQGELRLRDLGSRAGTYLNRRPVQDAVVVDGDEIWLGAVKLFVADGVLKQYEPARGIRVEARGVGNVVGGGRRILEGVDLAIYPGELVALVGPSGAGKTTLLHDLLGFTPPTEGVIFYDSHPLATDLDLFRRVLGYVPQADIIHPQLSVEQTLRYAGRLRLPADTTDAELATRIERVLEQVGLTDERSNRVSRLSGGQRKRASIAVELLTEPRVIFLDEPTSGLDPGLDEQMMELFRRLADQGRTVVLTTHATRNLRLSDRVVILSRGRQVFMGTPEEALTFFAVEDFIDVYPALTQQDAVALSESYRASALYERAVAARLVTPVAAPTLGATDRARGARMEGVRRSLHQFRFLSARYWAITKADRTNLALLVLLAPVIGALLVPVFRRDIFELSAINGGSFVNALVLQFVIVLSAFFLGAVMAAREITKEAAIYRRERLVDLSPVAYVASKVVVLLLFALLQAVALVGVLALAVRFPAPQAETIVLLMGVTMLTSMAGMAMGLFVSALSRNADQAMTVVPLLLIPQIIYAGVAIPLAHLPGLASVLSEFMVSKWAVELMGHTTEIGTRVMAQTSTAVGQALGVRGPASDTGFESAFDIATVWRWLVLAAFFLAFTLATLVLQWRKGRF
ncbi:MAG: ATP-binding cassette domain-containing protein [Chloroflexi bacterium]|nr:ATP-binding cassette domain-containing protein [Chloroflexota bacterium]